MPKNSSERLVVASMGIFLLLAACGRENENNDVSATKQNRSVGDAHKNQSDELGALTDGESEGRLDLSTDRWMGLYQDSPESYLSEFGKLKSPLQRDNVLTGSRKLFSTDPDFFLERIRDVGLSSSQHSLENDFVRELYANHGGEWTLQYTLDKLGVGTDRRFMLRNLYLRWFPDDFSGALATFGRLPFPEDRLGFLSALEASDELISRESYDLAVSSGADRALLEVMERVLAEKESVGSD